MSLVSKALISAATVFVGNEVRRYASTLELDDVLRPMGLERRRTHLGESLLFMGAGVVLGGAAAMILASTTRYDITEWLSKGPKEAVDDAKEAVDDVKAVTNTEEALDIEKPGGGSSVGDNGQPLGAQPV